jgi:diguanylate cyclase (GGDEF)-like protein
MAVDFVTGLEPRGPLENRLAELLAAGGPRPVAVVICDVIGLKHVNDHDGFRAGDAVLAAAAATLAGAAAGARIVARLGGDELVAVFAGGDAPAVAARTAARLRDTPAPRLRSAAVVAEAGDTPGRLFDRLYATMRDSGIL